MTFDEVMTQLKRAGTAQNRKVYKRHGFGENMFGVSFAALEKLRRGIKQDHELAVRLWQTENIDARNLATLVADPAQLTSSLADEWVRSITCYIESLQLAGLTAKAPCARSKLRKWTKQKKEYVRATGYFLLGAMLKRDGDVLDDDDCMGFVTQIEVEIHQSKNRARNAMNGALISIGSERSAIRTQILAAARRIGVVDVDHGETGCRTPDAEAAITKAAAKRKKKPRKRASAQ